MSFTQDGDVRKGARVTEHTFMHIYSRPLVHRPKGVLLVLACIFDSQATAISEHGYMAEDFRGAVLWNAMERMRSSGRCGMRCLP